MLAGGLEAISNCEQITIPGAGEPREVAYREGNTHTRQSGAFIP